MVIMVIMVGSDKYGLEPFRTVSDHFRTASDSFGRFRIVFRPFSNRLNGFVRFSDRFRSGSDRFRTVSDRLRAVSDESIPNFKISNFNWPGLGHRRGRPPFRPVGVDRCSQAGFSPCRLKFEEQIEKSDCFVYPD